MAERDDRRKGRDRHNWLLDAPVIPAELPSLDPSPIQEEVEALLDDVTPDPDVIEAALSSVDVLELAEVNLEATVLEYGVPVDDEAIDALVEAGEGRSTSPWRPVARLRQSSSRARVRLQRRPSWKCWRPHSRGCSLRYWGGRVS